MCVDILRYRGSMKLLYAYSSDTVSSPGLTNDHKAWRKKIEEGLHKIHALAGTSEVQQPVSTSDNQEAETLEPFLRVNLVSSGSPAEIAVR